MSFTSSHFENVAQKMYNCYFSGELNKQPLSSLDFFFLNAILRPLLKCILRMNSHLSTYAPKPVSSKNSMG